MGYFRTLKSTNEKRKAYDCDIKYIRGKHRANHPPNSWYDIDRAFQKSWKWQTRKSINIDMIKLE